MLQRLMYCTVAALLLSGCWPSRVTYRPGIAGTVISADDGKAIVGATVKLIVPREDLVPVLAIATNSDGRFELEAYYRWGLASIFGESFPARGTLEIAAAGFVSHTEEVFWSGPRMQQMGEVQLVPLR